MPTIMSHAAVPLAVAIAAGERRIPRTLLLIGVAGSMVPDLDVIGREFGVPRGTDFAHRGFTHSLMFAAAYAASFALLARRWAIAPMTVFFFLFGATASHGVLDAFTNGGSGIAFLWPFSSERFVAPVQPIEVSPIGVSRFLSERGVTVMLSELIWVWLPLMVLAFSWRVLRRNK